MISWPSLEKKINECHETHNECRHKAKGCLPRGFRVIDVIRRCLIETTECRFVALSYVWGTNPRSSPLGASSLTIGGMRKEGGLPTLGMPRTIEDAIRVCIFLGQKYLWVDRLCVIQDDDDDKKNQIEAMGNIYSSADLVLLATYGDSMEFGIPGVGHLRKLVQHQEDILGLRITNVIREVEDDPLDMWHTRGWTYQEAVLSRRRLYFTNTRAFFECEQSMCHEDQFNRETSRNDLLSIKLTIPEDDSRFQSFARHLTHYTSRKLTYRSDAYDAVKGILNSLYDGKSTFENGLPRLDFDRALLWFPDNGENSITRLESQGPAMPTWSWSSVMGLSDQVRYQETAFYGSLTIWHLIKGPFPPGSIEAVNIGQDPSVDDDWQTYMAIACSNDCVENFSLPLSLQTHGFSSMRDTFNTCWKIYQKPCKETMLLAIQETEFLKTRDSVFVHDTEPGFVVARCQTTFLPLAPKSAMYDVNITNSEGERIGQLCGGAAKIREEVTSSIYDRSAEVEFIALSLSGLTIRVYSSEELEAKKFIDAEGHSLAKVPIVNVLMISREGGLAHRRALGWIYLIDWIKLHREWKMIMLG